MVECKIAVRVSYPPASLIAGIPPVDEGERDAQRETTNRLLRYLASTAFREAVKNQVEGLLRQEPAVACCDVAVQVSPR